MCQLWLNYLKKKKEKELSKLRTAMANKLWAGLKRAHSCTVCDVRVSAPQRNPSCAKYEWLVSEKISDQHRFFPVSANCQGTGALLSITGRACQCKAGISSASHGEFSSVGNGFIMASHTEQNSCQLRALTLHTIQINLLWAAPQGLDCVFKWRHFKNRLKETRIAELQWFQFVPTNLSPAGSTVPEFVVAAAPGFHQASDLANGHCLPLRNEVGPGGLWRNLWCGG